MDASKAGPNTSIVTLLLALLTMQAVAQTRPAQKPRPVAEPQSRSADALQEAESLLQKQQYAEAETKLQSLIGTQAENPQVWFDLGFAESHLGRTTESASAYKKAAELSPKWFEASLNLGLALAKAGNLTDAASALKITVTLKPTTGGQLALSKAWLSLAQVTEGSQPQEALVDYQKAIELDPTNAESLLGAGKLMEQAGDLAGAEHQYLKTAEMGKGESVERLITLYLKQKRYSDAETWLRKYMAGNPQNMAAQTQLAKLLEAQGKNKEAIAILEGLNTSSIDPKMAREMADLYLQDKQYDPAAKLFQDLAKNDTHDAQLHRDYGTALLHQLKYADAQAELLKAVQIKPDLADAYFDLGYAAQQNKNYELAIRALDARARLLPETPGTLFLRATAYDSLRLYKPAVTNYKLFLAAAAGKFPDQEFQARHRLKAIEPN